MSVTDNVCNPMIAHYSSGIINVHINLEIVQHLLKHFINYCVLNHSTYNSTSIWLPG